MAKTVKEELDDIRKEWNLENNRIQTYFFTVDEISKEISSLRPSMDNMAQNFEEIKGMMKEGFSEMRGEVKTINAKFEALPEKFVRRDEHDDNKSRIARMEWGVLSMLIALCIYLISMAGDKIFK